jgi:anti-sigma B factor antagonist
MARRGERVERSSGAAPPPQPAGSGLNNAPALLEVRIQDSDGASIVALAGELDLSTLPRMEVSLWEQLDQRRAVLVDLSDLTFIDSSGIGALIEAFQSTNGRPMGLLIGPDSQVERVFGIAGIADALPVYTDRGQAMAALNGGTSDEGDGPG